MSGSIESDPTETNPNETNPQMTATGETGTSHPDAMDTTLVASAALAPKAMVRPRIRSGAIAWGLIVSAISVTVLVTVSSPAARNGFLNWAIGLGPGGQALVLVLGLGVFILLLAGLSLIRRAQKKLATRRSTAG